MCISHSHFIVCCPLSCLSLCSACMFCCVRLFETPWTVDCQAPLFVQFFRQNYWNGLLFPPPGDLPHPGIEPTSPA